MLKTSYDVVIHNDCIVAFNIDSFEEADMIRQHWLNCYPYLKITVCPHSVSFIGGDSLVTKTI